MPIENAHIDLVLNFNNMELADLEKLCFQLYPNRVESASRLSAPKKKLKLAAFLLAAFCIKQRLKISNLKFFKINGKPFLKNQKNAFFNISHTSGAVVCVAASVPIGVDLEKIRPLNLNLARKICCKSELVQFFKLPKAQQTQHLFKIWTAKESFAKMRAESVFKNLNLINHEHICNLKTMIFKNYALSVCSKTAQNFKFNELDFEKIISFLNKN